MSVARASPVGLMILVTMFAGVCPAKLSLPPLFTPTTQLPHLERRGQATQLIVDGKPFLMLAGELHNSSSSSLEYLEPIWPKLNQMHLNTVLAVVSWDLTEPREGQFDFTLVDGLIREARRHDLRLVLLWFGSWKNGISHYVPQWVKWDTQRFPRVRIESGRHIEVLSTFSSESVEADARAFAALMRHVRKVDGRQRTVLMIQMENEVGVLGDSRDRCDAANEAFAGPVPQELTTWLAAHKETLLPEVKGIWSAAGSRQSGTWSEVFGEGVRAEEIFMAWRYARYLNRVTEAGKAEYALPVYVNAWIVQPMDTKPGDYPSGGPQAHVHDIWRAGAPQIDLLAPDIYLPNFAEITAMYARAGNPLFVPESRAGVQGAANAFYAFGQMKAIGYSPFGIEDRQPDPANGPISQAYDVLSQLAPLILEGQSQGTIAGVSLNSKSPMQRITLGNYTLEVALRRQRRTTEAAPAGYGILLCVAPEEYVIAGSDIQVTFFAEPPGQQIVGLASVYEGRYVDGRWAPGRKLNGDNIMLNYHLDQMAAENRPGSVVRLESGPPAIRRVTLYRF